MAGHPLSRQGSSWTASLPLTDVADPLRLAGGDPLRLADGDPLRLADGEPPHAPSQRANATAAVRLRIRRGS